MPASISLKYVDTITPDMILRLFSPEGPGVLPILGFLEDEARRALLEEVILNEARFHLAVKTDGKMRYDFREFQIAADGRDLYSFPTISPLVEAYAPLVGRIGSIAGFDSYPNTVSVMRYEKGSIGITSHQDHTSIQNLVSIFVLAGKAPFGAAKTSGGPPSDAEDVYEFIPDPGTLILMRAPRNPHEYSLRPHHYVGPVEEERTVIILSDVDAAFRHISR